MRARVVKWQTRQPKELVPNKHAGSTPVPRTSFCGWYLGA